MLNARKTGTKLRGPEGQTQLTSSAKEGHTETANAPSRKPKVMTPISLLFEERKSGLHDTAVLTYGIKPV